MSVHSVMKVKDPQSIRLSLTDPPALSKVVQIPDHRSIRLHVLVSGDAVVVSTQTPDSVLIGAGQYNL